MKKMISMVFAMVLAMGSMSAQTSANSIKMTAPFDKVQMDVAAKVRVVDGHAFGVNVRTNDKEVAEDIVVKVENGVLDITSKSGADLSANDKLQITIITPNNPEIETSYCYETKTVEADETVDPEYINDLLPNAPERPFFGFPRAGRHFGQPHFGMPMHPFAQMNVDKNKRG